MVTWFRFNAAQSVSALLITMMPHLANQKRKVRPYDARRDRRSDALCVHPFFLIASRMCILGYAVKCTLSDSFLPPLL
jgi:hypothetical protein